MRRLFVLLCGYEFIPRSVSLRGADPRFLHAVPITAYLVETTSGWLLFDTGLDPENISDPARRAAYFVDRGWDPPPAVQPDHRLERQLAAVGIGFGDVSTVVVSHLHADHSGYLKFLRHARIVIQRAELDHAMGPEAGPAWFRSDYDLDLGWDVVTGDARIAPGIEALFTPGHTPGHQSLLLRMPDETAILLAADVGDLQQNFDDEILPGEAADDAAAIASIRRLKAVQAELGARLLITHDPDQIRAVPLAPEPFA